MSPSPSLCRYPGVPQAKSEPEPKRCKTLAEVSGARSKSGLAEPKPRTGKAEETGSTGACSKSMSVKMSKSPLETRRPDKPAPKKPPIQNYKAPALSNVAQEMRDIIMAGDNVNAMTPLEFEELVDLSKNPEDVEELGDMVNSF